MEAVAERPCRGRTSVRPYWRLLDIDPKKRQESSSRRNALGQSSWCLGVSVVNIFRCPGGEERPFKRIFHEIPDAAMSILNFRIAKNLPAVKDRLISPSLQIRDGTGEKMGKGSFPFGRSGECGVRDCSARKDCLTPAWSR